MSSEITQVLVRPAAAEDAEPGARTLIASRRAAEATGNIPVGGHDDDDVVRWFVDEIMTTREVWVAESAGEIVGVLVLDETWLDHLYVRPDRSREGIGSLLLSAAAALRPDGVDLWVFQSNIAARGFYERHGLVEVERTDGAGNEESAPDIRYRLPR